MSQPPDPPDRIRAGDVALVDPFGHTVSINESHAWILGWALGFFAGKRGLPLLAAGVIVYAALRPATHNRTMGSKTLTHEPWYAAAGVVAGYLAGRALRPRPWGESRK